MNILSVAFPLLPVSSDSAGGSEQIVWHLDRGVVDAGYGSTVIAAKGSSVKGLLIPTPAANHEITDEIRYQARNAHRKAIQTVLETNSIDLIHFHGLDFADYLPTTATPMLATLHLPASFYPEDIFEMPGLTINAVSHSQAATLPSARDWPVISNGIDVTRYRASPERQNFLCVLARICPEKGIDIALRVAHRLGVELMLAGPVHPFAAHQEYFEKCVKPLLDAKRQYIGPVGMPEKIDLLSRARCLLIPSFVAETSSLVAMEALASGTPVIAHRCGALPELVEQGVTGFIVESEEEMACAVERVDTISHESCHTAAVSRFDANRMIREYLSLYERLRLSTKRQRRIG